MKKAHRRGQREPSKRSLREIPEVDFPKVRVKRNRYARRIAAEGLTLHAALREAILEWARHAASSKGATLFEKHARFDLPSTNL